MTHSGNNGRLLAFIHHEATAGLILVLAAAAAMTIYNVEWLRPYYDGLLGAPVTVSFGALGLSKPAQLWINDGLMAIFFLLVGLEIKREILEGNLSSRDQIVLPAIAAAGGMAVPALIYGAVNMGEVEHLRGWAIPAATDIAFALAALSLAGSRVPPSLKVFLLTLATLDDLGAIVIIAIFYTADLSLLSLGLAGTAVAVLFALNVLRVDRMATYVLVGIALWIFVLKSGVHATLAGVVLGLAIPLRRRDGQDFLARMEEWLHPYVTFAILPVFAFANAGIPASGFGLATLSQSLPLGIAAGLAIGKPLGILASVAVACRLGVARLPQACGWMHMAGVGCLAGIGFTMSLFIGTLAFAAETDMALVRVGVVTGSLVSAAVGLAVLGVAIRRPSRG